jgi:hypothetical protein
MVIVIDSATGAIKKSILLSSNDYSNVDITIEEGEEKLIVPDIDFKTGCTYMYSKSLESIVETENTSLLQKTSILSELAQLDTQVPRLLEDLIAHTSYAPHTSKQVIITRKQELRQQLVDLG